jgi:hypothetical protein
MNLNGYLTIFHRIYTCPKPVFFVLYESSADFSVKFIGACIWTNIRFHIHQDAAADGI